MSNKRHLFLHILISSLLLSASSIFGSANRVQFKLPNPEYPYYYALITCPAGLPQTGTVTSVQVNGEKRPEFQILGAAPDSVLKTAAADSSLKLLVRCDWRLDEKFQFKIRYRTAENKKRTLKVKAHCFTEGGYWSPYWANYYSVVVSEKHGIERKNSPVMLRLPFKNNTIARPKEEIRIVYYDRRSSKSNFEGYVEVPHTVMHVSQRADSSYTVDLVYYANLQPNEQRVYLAFFNSQKALLPYYKTQMATLGNERGEIFIKNSHYVAGFDSLNHALNLLGLYGAHRDFYFKAKPPRGILHHYGVNGDSLEWQQDPVTDGEKGLYTELVKQAYLKNNYWSNLTVKYQFLANQPYFFIENTPRIEELNQNPDFLNEYLDFSSEAFDLVVWENDLGIIEKADFSDSLIMPENARWFAGVNSVDSTGVAFILPPGVSPVTQRRQTASGWHWTIPITAPAHRYAVMPFELGIGAAPFGVVEWQARQFRFPLDIKIWRPKEK
ncbi:hypothetical protein KAH55_00385 [bacterium]|nr:hypothetical protein [bacterium]